jgi:2-(acetamidomethylene)succinate hydrolase
MTRGPGVSREAALDRVRLHYVDWPGTEPVVVLLHPNRTNARVWDFVVAHSSLPNRFVALDHRGHGLSEWPESGYTLEDYVADDIAFLQHLQDLGAGPVILAGAATGGNVAVLLASQRPDLVRALALLDPGLSLDPGLNAVVQDQIERGYTHDSFEAAAAAMPFSELWTDAMRAHFAAHSFRRLDGGRWAARYRKEAAQETEALLEQDLWDRITVSCPTLAVRGARSRVFSRDKLVRLAGLLPEAVMAEIPRADHRVTQDNPPVVAALLDGFIRGLTP